MMLTEFETEAIRYILEHEAPTLLGQLTTIRAKSRSHAGSGYYLDLDYGDTLINDPSLNLTLGKSVYGDVVDMKWGVGFMLFVDDGAISTLEVFSHAHEELPASISKCTLSYLTSMV